jgi:hypothetical protein
VFYVLKGLGFELAKTNFACFLEIGDHLPKAIRLPASESGF